MTSSFSKKHLDYPLQIELLKSRNLDILDHDFAIKKLKNLNYYRLTPYFYPFFERKDYFKDGYTFEKIINLYDFDRDFRTLIFKNIEDIEVYIRAKLSFSISKFKGAFGYLDKSSLNYKYQDRHEKLIDDINKEVSRSKEVFVEKYINEIGYLPVWAMVEVISMGSLSMLYSYLDDEIRKDIVKDLGQKTFILQSWLHTLTYIRNICAHHSRLWNRDLAIEPIVPRKNKKFSRINNKKIFFILVIINELYTQIDIEQNTLLNDITILFEKYKDINIRAMGFPIDWQNYFIKVPR
ncbi:Abi family protein [Francisella philomiragia]|uniref:Abi family protein n=1 Tax=Francisella philomiragia TaxID=28110 RepID=UPI000B588759|nr:Abi family protein [Francisella philomiragia]MBK2095155.1 Abi family protein [Francisella philomiragia]